MKWRACLMAAWFALAFISGLAGTLVAGPLSVTWGAQSAGGGLASADGRELPAGCLVRLGVFSLPLEEVKQTAWDPVFLNAHFTEMARSAVGEFGGVSLHVSGAFAHHFTVDSLHLSPQLANRPVCVWVINAQAPPEATETAILTSPSWTLRLSALGTLIWDLSDVEPSGLIAGSFSQYESPSLGGRMNQLASIFDLWDASDLDRDGVTALLEDAFGMNPDSPDAAMMPALVPLTAESGEAQSLVDAPGMVMPLGYRFRCVSGGTQVSAVVYETQDFRYVVEVSQDLRSWRIDPAACQLHNWHPAGNGFDFLTLRPTPRLGVVPDFYRLKVERRTSSQ